jgi:hypothetical protein
VLRVITGLAAAAALYSAQPAAAAVVLTNYSVSGTASGTFTLSYDDGAALYSVSALNLVIAGDTFVLPVADGEQLGSSGFIIGAIQCGLHLVCGGSIPDFAFLFDLGSPSQVVSVLYNDDEHTGDVLTGSATITQTVAAVPEPSTWIMMLFGFGGVGWAVRRRRRPEPSHQLTQ